MKIVFYSLLLLAGTLTNNQVELKSGRPVWDTMVRDLGGLPADTTVTVSFTCFNKSNSAIHVERLELPCKCTTAEPYPEKTVAGDSFTLRFRYSTSGRNGTDNKYIGVYTNHGLFELKITARINRSK